MSEIHFLSLGLKIRICFPYQNYYFLVLFPNFYLIKLIINKWFKTALFYLKSGILFENYFS